MATATTRQAYWIDGYDSGARDVKTALDAGFAKFPANANRLPGPDQRLDWLAGYSAGMQEALKVATAQAAQDAPS